MFRQLDFRSFFNFLGRNKLYTAINIFGLSLSLMFVILIADYTVRQLTVDSFHSKAGRIYVVSNENTVASAYFLQKHLLDRYPEIEATCAVSFEDHHTVEADGKLALADVLYADTTFFRIFDFELAAGDRRQALAARDNVVLSESFARRMFGDADPVGRSLVAEGKSYTVSAVMRDIERSVIPPVDLLYRGDLLTKKNNNNESMSNVGSCCTFLLAREGADLRAKLPDMLDYFKTIYLPYTRGFYRQVTLLPLREVYFSSLDSYGNLSSGNRSFVTILMAIGIVILLFAVINYVNLTAAQTGFRAKEMATRRLLGATKGEVVLKLILESTLMCCTAFAVAFLLAEAAEPYAARLLGAKIDISAAATPERIAWYALFLLALGFVSGIVPATLVARYKPVDVMRGSLRHRTKQVYSKVLIVIQNAITVAMLATSLTVYAQTRHLIDAPLGYDTKDILMLRHDIFDGYDQMRRLRDELCSEPSVEAVAFSNATPLTKGSNWTMQYDGGRMISFEYFVADSVFFRILGLELLRDNHTEGWGFNQYAFKQMDIPEDTPGVRLANIEDPVSVAGIYRDFRFGSVLEKPTAMILWNIGDFDRFWNGKKLSAPRFPGYMLVKTRGDHDEAPQHFRTNQRRRIFRGALFRAADRRLLRRRTAHAAHRGDIHAGCDPHLGAGAAGHVHLLHAAETAGDGRTQGLRSDAARDAPTAGGQLHGTGRRRVPHRRTGRMVRPRPLVAGLQRPHPARRVDLPRSRRIRRDRRTGHRLLAEQQSRCREPRRHTQKLTRSAIPFTQKRITTNQIIPSC